MMDLLLIGNYRKKTG